MLKLDFEKGCVDRELIEYKLNDKNYVEASAILREIKISVKERVKTLEDREVKKI